MIEQNTVEKSILSREAFSLQMITKIGLLSAIAFVLMLIEFPIPLFPVFLKLDISDLPALIGGFALGPIASIIIQFIKNIFHFILKNDGTGGAGNLSNFIVGISLTVPASIVYMKNRSRKGALIGMITGTILMVLLSSFTNYYVIIPLYAKLYSMEAIMAMMAQANKNMVDIKDYVVYGVIPFNLIKAILTSIVTFLLYKKVSPILNK